jgi:hypothetical protein
MPEVGNDRNAACEGAAQNDAIGPQAVVGGSAVLQCPHFDYRHESQYGSYGKSVGGEVAYYGLMLATRITLPTSRSLLRPACSWARRPRTQVRGIRLDPADGCVFILKR